ncbi:hypothetical protein VTL71DRAFT_4743 [Oculimacula yallundae]|uniref:Mid2 domain-containing protein n=1 Tax=Oculimacula yallundae TaxID=86028 RepID=A0ABR4C4K5_9HELO
MSRKHFVVLLGLLTHATKVVGKNDFNADFPTTFSFNATTPFFWLDIQGTNLASIFVIGDSNQFELVELPLDPQGCVKTTLVDNVAICTLWSNNGTATFGGNYAAKLVAGQLYHMVLDYEDEDATSKGSSESAVFRMLNPLPLPTGTGSTISTSISIVSQETSSSQPADSLSNSGSMSRSPTSSNSVTIPTTSSAASSPPSSSSSSAPTQSPQIDKGLTPGAKAGITVGVLSVIVIVFLAFFFFHRRRQVKRKKPRVIQQVNRNTGIDLDDIAITLGSPVTYDRVSEGRKGWHQRDQPPLRVLSTPGRTAQSPGELHGSPF